MRPTPFRTLLLGVLVFTVGFAIGLFGIDPLSAWIGTAGLAVTVVGLAWVAIAKLHAATEQPR